MTKSQQRILALIGLTGYAIVINKIDKTTALKLNTMGIVEVKKLPASRAFIVRFNNHKFDRGE
jgi:hypothetical protein